MSKTVKISITSIITALSLVLMFMTGLLPFMTYTLPGIAGMLLMIIVIEISKKWAFSTYIATALLSILIAPDKEAALLYVMFLGYYPILKSVLEKIKNPILEWILKIAIFNISVIAAYFLLINVFTVEEAMNDFGKYTFYILLGLGNITFILYDFALTKLVTAYMLRFRQILFKKIIRYK